MTKFVLEIEAPVAAGIESQQYILKCVCDALKKAGFTFRSLGVKEAESKSADQKAFEAREEPYQR